MASGSMFSKRQQPQQQSSEERAEEQQDLQESQLEAILKKYSKIEGEWSA